MPKLAVFNMMTLDGYFEGTTHDINWHNVDEEFNQFALDQIEEFGAILFGRITYDMMASYWPDPETIEEDPLVAKAMNSKQKYVFSKTLTEVDWSNSTLLSGELEDEIRKLKAQDGKDLIVFGSGSLMASIGKLGLIDEYRIMINPVVIGYGIPLFKEVEESRNLELIKSRAFGNGNVLLIYKSLN